MLGTHQNGQSKHPPALQGTGHLTELQIKDEKVRPAAAMTQRTASNHLK